MRFDWHSAKRDKTFEVRKVDFAEVVACFDDPARLIKKDLRKDYGEARYNILGKMSGRLYHVTFTLRGDVVWIISARKANDRELATYEAQ